MCSLAVFNLSWSFPNSVNDVVSMLVFCRILSKTSKYIQWIKNNGLLFDVETLTYIFAYLLQIHVDEEQVQHELSNKVFA